MMESKTYLMGMTMEELQGVASGAGLPPYAARQIADWLYKQKVASIAGMTNIAITKRDFLAAHYDIGITPSADAVVSSDGTVKYLFPVGAEKFVETVYIPSGERSTLCVSSQVGCRMNCLFCQTGKQGFAGNLSANEMLNQILSVPESGQLSNIVFMGMGEPLDNTDALLRVLEILTSSYGFGWSPTRITVSTAGLIKGLKLFLASSPCNLAISLHSPYADERRRLMPIEKTNPIRDVMQLIRQHDFTHQQRVSFEYILFANLNDSAQHATDVAKLLAGVPCRLNLINYHPVPGSGLKHGNVHKMELFRDIIAAKGITCTIRASRGEDIAAACGMLSTEKSINNKESYD